MESGSNFDPMAHFQIGQGMISLSELGQHVAGSSENAAFARGQLLAGMAIRVMNRIEEDTSWASDANKSTFLYEKVMAGAADAARPPLSPADKEEFMAGARQALGGAS